MKRKTLTHCKQKQQQKTTNSHTLQIVHAEAMLPL
jgi:hypothetical protein